MTKEIKSPIDPDTLSLLNQEQAKNTAKDPATTPPKPAIESVEDVHPDATDDQPWSKRKAYRDEQKHQIKGESDESWQAFVLFRDMPFRANLPSPRSLAKVAKELSKSVQLIYRWSERWDWSNRAAAFDDYMDKEAIKENVWRLTDMRKRHGRYARIGQNRAIKAMISIPDAEITMPIAINLLKVCSDLECRSLGEPIEINQTKGDHSIKWIQFGDPEPEVKK